MFSSRKFPLLSLALALVLVVVAIVAFVASRDTDSTDSAPSPGPSPSAVVPGRGGDGPCGLPGSAFSTPSTDQRGKRLEVPVNPGGVACPQKPVAAVTALPADGRIAAPEGLAWEKIAGVALPVSADAGPARIDGAVASGFAHTPQGAVLAGIHVLVAWSGDIGGQGRERIGTERMMRPQGAPMPSAAQLEGQTPPEFKALLGVPAAVRVTTYAADFARVEWAYHDGTGFRWLSAELVWDGGDWKSAYKPAAEQKPTGDSFKASLDGTWSTWS